LQTALTQFGSSISDGLRAANTDFARRILDEWNAERGASGPDVSNMSERVMIHHLQRLCRAYANDDTSEIERMEPMATHIGIELNRRGGLQAMLRVHAALGGMLGARTLEMHWGGIGEWRG